VLCTLKVSPLAQFDGSRRLLLLEGLRVPLCIEILRWSRVAWLIENFDPHMN
jgi:hypothetical protein